MSHLPPGLPFLADPVNAQHTLNQGRVAWWLTLPGIEGGATFYDLMGLHPGVLTSMTTSASGWRGTTRPGGWGDLLFDGVDDLVEVSSLQTSATLSVAAWVNLSTTGAMQFIVDNDNSLTTGRLFQFRVTTGGALQFIVFSSGNTNGSAVGSFVVAGAGWTRVAGTWNGATVTLYVNGVVDGTPVSFSGPAANTANASVTIGNGKSVGNTGAAPANGRIDDVSIWARALSASEVKADYDLSRMGYPGVLNFGLPGLVDSPASGTDYSRTGADTLTLTDSQSRYSVFARTGAESLTLTDTAARAALFARALAETLTATDTASRFGDFARAATETLTATETLSRYGVFARALAESLTATDTLSRNAAYLRTVAESLTLTDTETRSAAFVRTAADALTLSESLLTDLIGPGGSLFARSFDETLTLTEARAAVWSFTRRGADTLTLTDALTARQRAILRQFAETITAADVSSSAIAGVLTTYFTETLNLSDALSRRLASAISGAAVLRVKGAAASHSLTGQPKTAETKTGGITGRPGTH